MFPVKHFYILMKRGKRENDLSLGFNHPNKSDNCGYQTQDCDNERSQNPPKPKLQAVDFVLCVPKIVTLRQTLLHGGWGGPLWQLHHRARLYRILLHINQAFVAKNLGFSQFLAAFHTTHSGHLQTLRFFTLYNGFPPA